jgi:hypothetical protein
LDTSPAKIDVEVVGPLRADGGERATGAALGRPVELLEDHDPPSRPRKVVSTAGTYRAGADDDDVRSEFARHLLSLGFEVLPTIETPSRARHRLAIGILGGLSDASRIRACRALGGRSPAFDKCRKQPRDFRLQADDSAGVIVVRCLGCYQISTGVES